MIFHLDSLTLLYNLVLQTRSVLHVNESYKISDYYYLVMANIDIPCPIAGCEYSTRSVPEAVAVVLLSTHAISHTASSNASNVRSGPKLDRPKVELGISMEQWNLFVRKWNVFKTGSNIADGLDSIQLFQCAEESLGDAMLMVDSDITAKSTNDVLELMKSLTVIPVAIGVLRAELLGMKQKRDEPFRTFRTFRTLSSRVRGKAETCEFFTNSEKHPRLLVLLQGF